MALQPGTADIDRTVTTPFLLRLYWRTQGSFDPLEFSVAPPAVTASISDYSQILPTNIRQQSVQIYTWPDCTLAELTSDFTNALVNAGKLQELSVGTRLVYSLIFPDTRAPVGEGGRGRWMDKLLGTVVVGGNGADMNDEFSNGVVKESLEGDAQKTLAGARFVIGDYIACSILPPGPDGRVAPLSAPRGSGRNGAYGGPRENGFGRGGAYRGGYGGGGFGANPPRGDWRRGERPPGGFSGYGGGGRGGRPY